MNINMSLPADYRIDEDFWGISVSHHVRQREIDESLELYHQLTSEKGQNFINCLRTEENVIILCQIRDLTKQHDFVRIVLSGKGLLRQGIRKEVVVSETIVSCLSTCSLCRFHGQTASLKKLITMIENQRTTSSHREGKVDKPST